MKSYIFSVEEMERELQVLKADKWAGIKIYIDTLGDLHMIKTDEKAEEEIKS